MLSKRVNGLTDKKKIVIVRTYPGKTNESDMQEKQKVTLYLPQRLHRQLKIKSAVDLESMSAMVEKALAFYLENPEKVEDPIPTSHGRTHQVHLCPECNTALVMKDGELVSLKNQPSAVLEEEFSMEEVKEKVKTKTDSQGELVVC